MALAIISLVLAVVSAIVIAFDFKSNPQSMRIMNVVWVLTALWGSLFGLVAYFAFGREKRMDMPMGDMEGMDMSGSMSDKTSDKMDMPQRTKESNLPKQEAVKALMKKHKVSRSYIEQIIYEKAIPAREKECVMCEE